ncbi:MAG: adenosine kinase [Bacteroidaceae bacterium]|nr:adenosine kinase [Bacteroidaceae bacterium]
MEKIIGIGNALVDILVRLKDDSLLQKAGLPKGGMTLIDEARQRELRACMEGLPVEQATGGSAGNTMLALARLGGNAGFVGKVGRDALAGFYADNCKKVGIEARLLECDLPTGVANTFISPDGERTFGTYLGAAATLQPSDITPELFEDVGTAHIEGYLVQNHDLMEAICQTAMEAGTMLSLDLASYNVVAADLDFFHHLVQDYIDIVFANEEEAQAFTGKTDPIEALREIAAYKCLAVVKLGSKGASVRLGDEEAVVPSMHMPVVDTTAAGDFFAGGFLYALNRGASLKDCLNCGSLLAGHIIGVVGTRLPDETWKKINVQCSMFNVQ